MLEKVVFLLLLILGLGAFITGVLGKWRKMQRAEAFSRKDKPLQRLLGAMFPPLIQSCAIARPRLVSGFFHALVAWGFFSYVFALVAHTSETLFGISFLSIPVLSSIMVLPDVMAPVVLVAVVYLAVRRYILRPKHLAPVPESTGILLDPRARRRPGLESGVILLIISILMLSYLLWEAGLVARTGVNFLPVGAWLAPALAGMSWAEPVGFWVHISGVIFFMFYIPRSKHAHLFWGPVNLFFRPLGPTGVMTEMNLEDETADHFGPVKTQHLSWKTYSDGYACIECGRCQEVCPAFRTEKPLSPKSLMENAKYILEDGVEGFDISQRLLSVDTAFSCTSCGACQVVCPVGNEQMGLVLETRRGMVLDLGQNPTELNQVYRGLEVHGNPWGLDANTRDNWFKELDAKRFDQADAPEYLLWEGCAGALDPKGQKTARAMVELLNAAGVSFGVAGSLFKCSGDLARRTGNEYLFQMLAGENVERFKALGVKKIITICPHCYHTLSSEYPQMGAKLSVVDHSTFLLKLLQENRLKLDTKQDMVITYHDPCYLARHHNKLHEPRAVIKQVAEIREMKEHGKHSLCCGGGGGGFWVEEKTQSKIYRLRTQQALDTRAQKIITACPFCSTMLEDGLKDAGQEDNIQVLDIAQLLAERLIKAA